MQGLTTDSGLVPLHAAEIAAREFPRARRGLDPDAVVSWLRAVAKSYAVLEEENRRLREERDRVAAAIRRVRDSSAAAIRSSLVQARLKRRAGGYDRREVESLLETAAAEIARLESRETLLRAELDRLERDAESVAGLSSAVAEMQCELDRLRERLDGSNEPPGLVAL